MTPIQEGPFIFGDDNNTWLEEKTFPKQIEKLHEDDQKSKTAFWAGVSLPTRGIKGFEFDLNDIDPETGLTRMVLLASGLNNIQDGHLLLVSSQRLGLNIDNSIFALGVYPQIKPEQDADNTQHIFQVRRGKRRVNGNFIGVLLNTRHNALKYAKTVRDSDGSTFELNGDRAIKGFYDMTYQSINAVIQAEKKLRDIQMKESAPTLMTQDELDYALDWLIAGDKVGTFERPPVRTSLQISIGMK